MNLYIKISIGLFLAFFANVSWTSLNNKIILGDVGEFILLCVCVLFFVVGILRAEVSRKV